MLNSQQRVDFWTEFICSKCHFPAPDKLREQFAHAEFSEFCECGCNSFKVVVHREANIARLANGGGYGMVFEADFRLLEPDRTLEIILFAGEDGNLAYVEIDCCGNSYPVPELIEVQEPPYHVHASKSLAL
jgi:hypothetical protein